LSSFTHPQEAKLKTYIYTMAPLTSIVGKKKTMEVNGANRSSKYLCVQQKKETHTGLQQLEVSK